MTTASNPLAPVWLTALALPDAGGTAPDEIMLLPAPLTDMRTVDGRGPFRLRDAQGLIARSIGLPRNGGKLTIDVNHATRKLGGAGFEAPARGWITDMLVRDGALWARVKWTEAGRAMVAAGEYLSVSPEILPDAQGEVLQILGASLTNDPALLGLATLTTRETPMNLQALLAARLGKPETTPAEELLTAIPDPQAAMALTALQADVVLLCAALGAKDIKEALVAVRGLISAPAQVETLTARLAAVEAAAKRQSADAWMAGEIAAKRGIPVPDQEGLILLHMEDPERAKRYAAFHPSLGVISHLDGKPPGANVGVVTLTAEQVTVADQLGIAHDKFLASLQADDRKESR